MIEPTRQPVTVPPRSYVVGEDVMDNLLIHQKDKILHLINRGEYEQALGAVKVLSDLWFMFGYSYKADEILDRIKNRRKHTKTT